MTFADFTFPAVLRELGLTFAEAELFDGAPPADIDGASADRIVRGAGLAANIDTLKARTDFVVGPVLFELWRRSEFALFSGVLLDVDPARGLTGGTDFLLSGCTLPFFPKAPLLAAVVTDNDNPRSALGRCIATMAAAWEFNRRADQPAPAVYGVVTTGTLWQFARLTDRTITVDLRTWCIHRSGDPARPAGDLPEILGILSSIVRRPPA